MRVYEHSCLNCGHNILASKKIKLGWLAHPDDKEILDNNIFYYCGVKKEHARGPYINKKQGLLNKNNCKKFVY